MSLTERIYGKETAGKPAVSSDTQKNLYTMAANKKPSLANRIAQNGGQPMLYADAAAKRKPSLASRIEANGGTPYADAAAQMKSGNAAKGTSVVFNSVYGKADDRESSAGSGKYADILKASDYAELSKSGESKRKLFGDARYDYINNIGNFRAQSDVQQAQGRGQDYGKYAFMTDDEIGVYNYLYATQGKKAANSYLSDLEPELDKQWYTGTNRATTEALGKNAATRTMASIATVAAQPTRTVTSMIAMADDAVRAAKGQEINPYSKWRQASNITQDLRSDTSQHIEETNPGMGGKVGSFVYNTAMSAADSAMNALVAKGIGEAVGLSGDTLMKATNILGSALMSSEVASQSIAESKEKGYSNAGALALGLTRGAIEYASEAIGGEWVIRKIKANPLSFVKSMALTMIPEGVEEVMSDAANGVVNLAIDAAFGTEESGIPKMLEYYRTSGTDWQKKHAELATVLAILGQEGLSFLGGALATLGSSSVQYGTNRANINQTAERLNTTPKNVVQMMQDAQTEDPGVIYALAELTDAENADDLRQKIGTKEDMKRAAEYLTQQMGADGRFGAQEGNYTAGAQSAPVGAQRAQSEGINTTPAAAINIQEGMNDGQSTYQGRENGSYDLRTGGQAAAEEGAQAFTGGRAEISGGVGQSAQADLRQVTPAQLGIRNGGTEAVTVVDAQQLGGEAKSAYDTVARQGMEPVAVRGAIQVGSGYANAYTESGRVFFRVDATDGNGNAISPEALVHHELFHNYISEEGLRASAEVIRESMTAEEYDGMYEAYRDAYASIYDFETMSVEEIDRILTEEIAADAYAGLNFFSVDTPVQEAVRAEAKRNAPAQRTEAQQQRTGPPGRATAAGINARTADSTTLRRAEAMEKSGASNEAIRQETGWYRGIDGQWRFEIDDSKIKLRYEATVENGREAIPNYTTLGKLIDAPELFAAYPDMRNMDVNFQSLGDGANGTYNRQFDSIDLSRELKTNQNDLLDTLTHEIQHAIQNREGFTKGASLGYWNGQLESGFDGRTTSQKNRSAQLVEKYNQLKSADPQLMKAVEELEAMTPTVPRGEVDWDTLEQLTPDPPEWERYDAKREGILEKYGDRAYEYMDAVSRVKAIQSESGRTPTQLYWNTAGEIEARDTVSRRKMTAEERKNTPPNLGDADTVFADGSGASMAYVSNDAARFNPEGKTQDELLHDIMDSAEPFDQRYLYFGRFTDSFRTAMEKAGVEVKNLPVIMSYRDAYLAMESRENGRYQGQDINYHNLGIEGMKSAMENIGKPDAVMKSKKDGKIELFLDFVDYKGNRGLAIVQLDSNAQHAQEFIRANIVTSIYGKRRGDAYLEKAKSEGRLVYSKEEGPAQGITQVQYESNINAKPSSTATIRQTEGNSQEKSSGKASVEVSGINNRTAAELQREYDRRTKEYQKAVQRDDPNYPYRAESAWIRAAEQRIAAQKIADGKRKRRNVTNTRNDIMRLFFTDKENRSDAVEFLNRKIGEMMAKGEITESTMHEIADEMLQMGSVESTSKNSPWIDETYENIRSDLSGNRLYVSEKTWRDFSKDEARTLRDRARQAGIILSKNENATAVDARNMELAEKYGKELFPTDAAVSDMLRNMVDNAERGKNGRQTLADRLWNEAGLDGAGKDQERAYAQMVNDLQNRTEVILREFAEDNKLKLREQERAEISEEDARRERLRKLQEADRKELDRLTKRDDTLHQINRENGRPMPNKGSGEVYRELMSKGKSEVLTPISMDNPRTLSYKITLDTDIVGVTTATVMHNGHRIYKETGPIKEYVARDVAEFVDVQANKNFSEENFERAKQLEAEKTSDEDARIAELFGDSEEAAKQELTDKTVESLTEKGQADKAEEYAARATIAGTTEKVIPEVLKAERNYREEIEKITSGAMRMFVNAGDTVRRIAKATKSKSLEGYYFNAGAYSQRAGNWIAKGGARTDIDGHKIGTSLADTLAPMRKDAAKYRDFQLYLLHMHNVDRMKYDNSEELQRIKDELIRVKDRYPQLKELSAQELARVASDAADDPISRAEAHEMYIEAHQGKNPRIGTVNMAAAYIQELQKQRAIVEKQGLKPVFGYDVTADDSQTAAMLLEAKNPEFKEWAKEVYKYSDDLIRYRVEAGLITREFADALKKRYPHYIPTFREEGTNSRKARSARRNGGIVVSNAIGRAVGSDGVLLPLHTALSRKTVSTMRNAGLNQFGLALVREYEGNKKAAEKYIWNVAESEYTPTEAAIESDEDYKPVFENIFSVKENGKAYDITMDEGLTAAMKAFEPDKFANYGAAKAMKKLNDLFKALCTGYNPIFMVRNLVRDAQDAAFYSTDSATWAKMFPSAWKQIVTNGEIWQQYKALGGSYASVLDYTSGLVKEPKNAAGKLVAKYETLGQAIEAAPRLAEFMTILANKGGSKTTNGVKTGKFTQSDLMEAMLGAADITTNFARGGTVTKMLNKYLVPFLNPSVQGADKFVRNITDRKGFKAWASLAIKAAALGILPELLNGLLYRDDDEWDDIPDQTKSNYYLFKLGDGYWLKIPRGRALAVFSAGATYAQEKAKGNDPKFSDVIEVVKSNVAPTDIFNQNIATAWTQTKLTNPDNPGTTWYGGNIESDRLQNYRPEDRYDEKTDELSKAIGKLFKVSPKKVNYLLDQYSGVIGDLLLPWLTPSATASSPALAPLKQAFMLDSTSANKTTGEYYDLLDDLKYDANDGDVGAGITRKYVSHAGDEVNDYYAQIREIQNDKELNKAEKNRLVRALKSQLIERQKEIIAQAEPYREAVDKYLKAHPELSTDNDAAIAEYAEQYEITEDQAESRMDAIVYREANREVFGAEYALRTYNADVYDKARTAYAKGVSYETYYDYYFATKEMHADKDENGKSISGSKKAKVVEYINSLDIPAEQKDALYVAAGYTEKSARYQKWNGGSGGSGRSGKRTTLKAPTPKAGKIIIPEAGSTAKSGSTSKTAKASGNVIADFTQKVSGTDIRKAATQAKRKALKVGNRTVYVEEGSPIDYFLKYGKLPSVK